MKWDMVPNRIAKREEPDRTKNRTKTNSSLRKCANVPDQIGAVTCLFPWHASECIIGIVLDRVTSRNSAEQLLLVVAGSTQSRTM